MGVLDEALGDLAADLLGTFSNAVLLVTTRTSDYDLLTAVDDVTLVVDEVPVQPGLKKTMEHLESGTVKATAQMVMLVAQNDLEAAGIVLATTSEVELRESSAAVTGQKYTIVALEPVYSGDQVAMVRIFANRA